jgi:CubicO group peptidase (beta-lactamase class C family)
VVKLLNSPLARRGWLNHLIRGRWKWPIWDGALRHRLYSAAQKNVEHYSKGRDTSWMYSNLGYVTLGILIHRVTGQYFGDFLQERVFKPLRMSTTRIISEADIIPNRAAGYEVDNGRLKNQEWVSPSANSTADGSMYFSILDLAKWDAALYTERVLKESSKREMWTVATLRDGRPNRGQYGFAWFIETQNGHRVVEHGGKWQGFTTQISRYFDDGLTVVILTNQANCDPHLIADEVAAIYLIGKPANNTEKR